MEDSFSNKSIKNLTYFEFCSKVKAEYAFIN
jgi:hypothetical protein